MRIGWAHPDHPLTAAVLDAVRAAGAELVTEPSRWADCLLVLSSADKGVPLEHPATFLISESRPATEAITALRRQGCGLIRGGALRDDLAHAIRLAESITVAANPQRLLPLLVRSEICHRLPNDPAVIVVWAAEVGRQAVEQLGWSPQQAFRLASVAAEAVENGMLRGNLEISPALADAGDQAIVTQLVETRRRQSPYRERSVWASCRFAAEDVCLVIRDEGPGARATAAGRTASETGRGGLILRALCSEVRYNADGNEVTLHVPSTDGAGDSPEAAASVADLP